MIEDLAIPFEAFDQVWISAWAIAWRNILITVDMVVCAIIAFEGLVMMHQIGHGVIRHQRSVELALKFTCASMSVWAFGVVVGYLTGALRFTPPVHVGLNISLAMALSVAISSRMPTGHPKLRVLYAGIGAVCGAILVIVAIAIDRSL